MHIADRPIDWPDRDLGWSVVNAVHAVADAAAVDGAAALGRDDTLVVLRLEGESAVTAVSPPVLERTAWFASVSPDGGVRRWSRTTVDLEALDAFPGLTQLTLVDIAAEDAAPLAPAVVRKLQTDRWSALTELALSILAECVHEAAGYLVTRPFGTGVLADQQGARFLVTDAWTTLEFLRSAVADPEVGTDAAARQAVAASLQTAVEQCAQALGGRGYLSGSVSGATYRHLGALTLLLRRGGA